MRLRNLDMNLIVALEAILRHRSVSAAADELHLTQPAVSRALGRLRTHFNDQIVVPVGRRMAPTEFGENLFMQSQQLLKQMRTFTDLRPDFVPATAKREVSIIASDYVIRVFLTPVARRLAQAAPGLKLKLMTIDAAAEAMFERASVDFRVVPDMALLPEHPHAPLFSDNFVSIVWDENPHVSDTLDAQTYLDLKHVTTAFGAIGRSSHFEQCLNDQDVDLDVALSVPNFVLLPECVVGTPYVATIHARQAALLPEDLPVKCFPLPIAVPPLVEKLQWHRLRRHDSASRWLREFLLQTAAAL